jgi:hypothetical protein
MYDSSRKRISRLSSFSLKKLSFQGVVHERTAEYKENLLLSCRHKSYQNSSYENSFEMGTYGINGAALHDRLRPRAKYKFRRSSRLGYRFHGRRCSGAKVTILNVDTGVAKDYFTNGAGIYDTVSILPGRSDG